MTLSSFKSNPASAGTLLRITAGLFGSFIIASFIGAITSLLPLVAVCGLLLLALLLALFAFAQFVVDAIRKLGWISQVHTSAAGILLRGTVLLMSFWLASVYAALLEGNTQVFLGAVRANLALSACATLGFVTDLAQGKGLATQGLLTRAISALGYLVFLTDLMVLGGGVGGSVGYLGMKHLFGLPPWFMSADGTYAVAAFFEGGGILLWALLGLAGTWLSLSSLGSRSAEKRNFAVAVLMLSLWLLTPQAIVILVQLGFRG